MKPPRIVPIICALLAGCGGQRDAQSLDQFLSSHTIDTVDVRRATGSTNRLDAAEGQKFVVSLNRTNRTGRSNWSKGEVDSQLILRSGTNEIWLSSFEDGTLSYGDYYFSLRK